MLKILGKIIINLISKAESTIHFTSEKLIDLNG